MAPTCQQLRNPRSSCAHPVVPGVRTSRMTATVDSLAGSLRRAIEAKPDGIESDILAPASASACSTSAASSGLTPPQRTIHEGANRIGGTGSPKEVGEFAKGQATDETSGTSPALSSRG